MGRVLLMDTQQILEILKSLQGDHIQMTTTVNEDLITIPRETYEILLDDSDFLACLQATGVDNWEGINEALELYNSK